MKPLYPITRPAPILFIIVIILGLLLLSCSSPYNAAEHPGGSKENLLHTTTINRNIIGYEYGKVFKKRMYYTVTDSEGKKAPRIHICKGEPVYPIGGILMLEEEYKLCGTDW